FRKSTTTSATLPYYKHKRFSLRHIPKTVPPETTASATAATSTIRHSATRASLSSSVATTASGRNITDTDTIPLTTAYDNLNINDNTGNEAASSAIYNNTAFVDNETCR
ncbi:Hypothetical predicted protein, partial [Drosophila guanche]